MKEYINVIGGGLAGCEAAYQIAKRGVKVKLYEMRPVKMTEAHKTDLFGELICSNSLRAKSIENAVGLLKEEMRRIGSIIMEAADNNQVEGGGALAVDRTNFASYVTEKIKNNPHINIINEEYTKIKPDEYTVIATGPLTSDGLYEEIKNLVLIERKASTSFIQRKFAIGYNKAARYVDMLEDEGIIGPENGSKPREVLVSNEDDDEDYE